MDKLFDFNKVDWKWVGISILIFFIAQIVLSVVFGIFGVLTLGIGFLLFIIFTPVMYFVGGFITGYASPGITLIEPAIGALIMNVAGALFNRHGGFGTIITAVIAFVFALIGAYMGEKFQSQTRNHTEEA